MTVFIGIDPGLTGALAVLDSDGHMLSGELHDTPIISTVRRSGGMRHEYNIPAMRTLIRNACFAKYDDVFIAIEESQAMPGQGVSSSHKIGMCFGIWLGVIATLGAPYVRVRPAVWKRRMQLPADKETVRLRAIEQFPGADLHRKKDHGRSEALFLAEYARRIRETVPAEM